MACHREGLDSNCRCTKAIHGLRCDASSRAIVQILSLHCLLLHKLCPFLGLLDLCAPVLEPDLDGALRHLDLLGQNLAHLRVGRLIREKGIFKDGQLFY